MDSQEFPHLRHLNARSGTFHWWEPHSGHLLGLPSCEFHECPHLRQVTRRLGSFHFTDLHLGHRFGSASLRRTHLYEQREQTRGSPRAGTSAMHPSWIIPYIILWSQHTGFVYIRSPAQAQSQIHRHVDVGVARATEDRPEPVPEGVALREGRHRVRDLRIPP